MVSAKNRFCRQQFWSWLYGWLGDDPLPHVLIGTHPSLRNSTKMQLNGKNVLITGGSAGLVPLYSLLLRLIYRVLNVRANSLQKVGPPKRCWRLGCNIAINYANSSTRAEAFGEELQSQYPSLKIVVIQADVGEKSACEALISETISALGGLDIIISNAGIVPCDYSAFMQPLRGRMDSILSLWGFGVSRGGVG